MTRVTVQEAQEHLEDLLRRVERGEEIVIMRSGHSLARLGPVEEESPSAGLPSLKEWRTHMQMKGQGLSEAVRNQREEERY